MSKRNMAVSIPTLPGHGTHAGDLFNYTWRDWVNCTIHNFEQMSKRHTNIVACGLSMGGSLALHLAAHRPVKAVISLSAPAAFPPWKENSVHILRHIFRFRYKRHGEDVRDTSARKWLRSYRRYPYYALEQLFELVRHVHYDLPEVSQPLLVIHSLQDHTIPASDADQILNAVSSVEKRKVALEKSYHIISVDVEKEVVHKEVLAFIHQHCSSG